MLQIFKKCQRFFVLFLAVVAMIILSACGSSPQFGAWLMLKEPTCLEAGEEIRYSTKDKNVFEIKTLDPLGHSWAVGGDEDGWILIEAPTYQSEGIEQRVCTRCNHVDTRIVDMLNEPTHLKIMDGNKLIEKIYVNDDGSYNLMEFVPIKIGYTFIRFYDENGNDYQLNGIIEETQIVYTEWDIIPTTTAEQLYEYAAAGADQILIDADITLSKSIYIVGQTEIYVNKNHVLRRAINFDGDLFIIGETEDGQNTQIVNGQKSVLTLKTENNAVLTIDGNKDNATVDVAGTAFLILHSAEFNLNEGVVVQNCKKVTNRKILDTDYLLPYPRNIGGAAVIVASGTFNMYGGKFIDNEVNLTENDSNETDADSEDNDKVSSCGGVIYNNSSVRIYGGLFQNNQAARGAVIYNYRTAEIYGGEFKSNQAGVYGGVIYLPNSQYAQLYIGEEGATKNLVTFDSNSASKSGGVIFGQMKNSVTIYGGAVFNANTAINSNGGAINTSGTLIIFDATFGKNTAASKGGAIYVYYSNDELTTREVSIAGGVFSQNEAAKGGAIAFSASDPDFDKGTIGRVGNVTFQGNKALENLTNDPDEDESSSSNGNGGAIYIARHSDVTIDGAIFRENNSAGKGGAIYITGGSYLAISATTFESNQATGNGGAVYAYTDTELAVNNCDFEANIADNRGGAIYLSGANATIVGGKFNGNLTNKDTAGAVAAYSDTELTIIGAEFSNNHATTNGGALYFSEAIATITDVTFIDNQAKIGGAIYFTSSTTATISGGVFTGNLASDSAGAIGVYSSAVLTVLDTQFTNNQATNGGAFYATGAAIVKIKAVNATGNTASKGGFLYYTTTNTTVYIYSGELFNNKAATDADGNNFWSNTAKAYLYIQKSAIQTDDDTYCGKNGEYTVYETIDEE